MYNDGLAALVLVSGEKARNLGLQVLARIRGYADVAQAPRLFIGGDLAFASRGSVFLGFVRATRRGPDLHHASCNKGDRGGLPCPGGCRALQPLGSGLRREARRLLHIDDHPGDRDVGGHRGGGPRCHRPGEGPPASELQALVDTSIEVVCLGWWWNSREGTHLLMMVVFV